MAGRVGAGLLSTLLMSVAFAGCFGGGDDVAPGTVTPTVNDSETQPAELPTGEECVACQEVNVTEEGVGGVEHKHDYWQGAETVTIYDYDAPVCLTPVFERDDNSKVAIAFINLENVPGSDDRPALVFEGTGLVTLTITSAPAWSSTFDLTFRSAAKDWSEPTQVTLNTPFEYVPEKVETDMPHSFRSLWNWKLQSTGPVPFTGDLTQNADCDLFGTGTASTQPLHVQIVVTKARDVDDWPGHPAFYEGTKERVVANEVKGSTTVQQAADVLIYGIEPDQVVPEKLVSMGTKTLDVWVNITKLELPPGVPNGGFTLYWRSADTRPDDLGHFHKAADTDEATYAHWTLELEESMLDSPYQPASRFGFKVLANAVNDDRVSCYRCVPYNVEYVMTIVARPDPEGQGATMADA